ncbi:MAG: hypothetical protein IJ706_04695 [Clostridia bacterium]|nr:hypothetical protein [Clostridia bacterium]
MEIFRVSLIGHRIVDHFTPVEEQLEEIIKKYLDEKEYVEFYIGRNGDFDILAASVIKRVQKDYGKANSSLILIIPYPIANVEDMEKYYDEVWYPAELQDVYYKAAITKRNEWFVKNSDELIAYVIRNEGGAYKCLRKAIDENVSIRLINCQK